ncbi:MAG: hypothetical protein ACR2HP_09785 [Ilumatobacteraceae bacterium]
MRRLGTFRRGTAVTAAGIVVAASVALPAAAGPSDDAGIVLRPSPVAAGDEFVVEVSGCTSGRQLQIQIDPAGVVAGATCEGDAGAPGFMEVAFLARGPLGDPGSYDVIALEGAQEIARASLEVVAATDVRDKRAAKKARQNAATDAPVAAPPDDPAAAPDDPAVTPAPDDPAAEPDDDDDDAAAAADESVAAAPDDPAAEPRQRIPANDEAVPTAGSAPPRTAQAPDRGLAATGPASSGPLTALAALALLAGAGLVVLTRRSR